VDGFAFDCPCCGKRHTGLPAVAYGEPAASIDEAGNPRPLRRMGDDFCIADGQYYFVRAVLHVPILGEAQPMEWGVWSSLSETNFKRYWDSFDDNDQAKLGPMFSYLGNSIYGYPGSLDLRSQLHTQNDRKRPFVELDPSQDHPLVRDQARGISRERAIELTMPVLHPQGQA
jgi:hypothetical protein